MWRTGILCIMRSSSTLLRVRPTSALYRFHPSTPLLSDTPKPEDESKITVRGAINAALEEEMRRDINVFIMGEEVDQYNGAYKVTAGLGEKFPGRVMDTPISEMSFTGVGIGASMAGLRPVVEFMSMNFSLQAIDQIVNGGAKAHYMSGGLLKCPIVFRGLDGASAGAAAQHSHTLANWYASVPGLKVFSIFSAEDAKGMIRAAIRDDNPVVVLESELLYGMKFDKTAATTNPEFMIPFGKAKIEVEGTDISIFTHGHALLTVLNAVAALKEKGIAAEVINLRSLRPLDRDTIFSSVKKTHRAVIVEEAFSVCGIGSEISAMLCESDAFYDLDAPVERVAFTDVPMPYASNYEAATIPQVKDVVETVIRVMDRSLPQKN